MLAATGVGAGDLLTASLAGSVVGLSVLWAASVGALCKWFLNEGLARWQMATGTTLLNGWITHLGRPLQWIFLTYFLVWSWFTGGALINACGVAGTGLFALSDDLRTSKIIWGIAHALIGLLLVRFGGFKLFEKLMTSFIVLMFVTVIVTAFFCRPDWGEVLRGLVVPRVVSVPQSAVWTVGVLGGVGGTLTMLSYGYWIAEQKRSGEHGLRSSRIDLAVGYCMTALFGVAMIIIGSHVTLDRGPTLALDLAGQLEQVAGIGGRWLFLVGFWAAVFSSLIGVWQSVPYLFADFWRTRRGLATDDLTATSAYRGYMLALAILPLPLLWVSVGRAQLIYAAFGALFMPFLAATLLLMNNRRQWVGRMCNGAITNVALILILALFAALAIRQAVLSLSQF